MDTPIGLQVRAPQFELPDPFAPLARIAQLQHAQTQGALGQLSLQQAQEQRGALNAFRDASQAGDPAALTRLAGFPELQAQAQKVQMTQDQFRNEKAARAAMEVRDSHPEGSPERRQAYLAKISELQRDGIVPPLAMQNLSTQDPTDKFLHGIISRAMPIQAQEVPKFMKVGEAVDKYGQKQEQYGFVDANRQKVAPYPAPGQGLPAGVSAEGAPRLDELTGMALLDALDPGDRSQVKAILDGRQAPPSANARNPRTQRLMEWVAQVDPTFDMTTWKTRNETRAAYAKGPEGRNVAALNTLPRHLEELYQAADDLKNWNISGGTVARHATNWVASAISPDAESRLKRFENARQAVAEELGKAFHGAAAVSATEGWKGQFDATSSDKALKASILEAIKLATGRTEELEANYTRAMNGAPEKPFISPSARKAFDTLKAKVAASGAGKADHGSLPQTQVAPPETATTLLGQIKSGAKQVTLPSGKVLSAQEYVDAYNQKYGAPK